MLVPFMSVYISLFALNVVLCILNSVDKHLKKLFEKVFKITQKVSKSKITIKKQPSEKKYEDQSQSHQNSKTDVS